MKDRLKAKMRAVWEVAADVVFPAMLLVLSGDLLYLYLAGRWYDPNDAIEKAELVLLCVFGAASVARLVYYFVRKVFLR